jgi:dUTP pyrophosphatase
MFAFAKVYNTATLPVRQNPTDAGMDLSACDNAIIPAHGQACVDTGIAVTMPPDCYARVAPRSGLAFKHSIDVLAGVVDCGYTASIKVILFNHSDEDYGVCCGDRIAQLIFEKIYTPNTVPELKYDQLKQMTLGNRGLSGFGSTGIQ